MTNTDDYDDEEEEEEENWKVVVLLRIFFKIYMLATFCLYAVITIRIQLTVTFFSASIRALFVIGTTLTRKLSFLISICIQGIILTKGLSFYILKCSHKTLQTIGLSYTNH